MTTAFWLTSAGGKVHGAVGNKHAPLVSTGGPCDLSVHLGKVLEPHEVAVAREIVVIKSTAMKGNGCHSAHPYTYTHTHTHFCHDSTKERLQIFIEELELIVGQSPVSRERFT